MGKLDEALDILIQFGLPRAQQNDRSSYTLLVLLNLKENDSWDKSSINLFRTAAIMDLISAYYGLQYAPNTRETIRRQTLHQFIQAGLVEQNADDPTRPTNSPYNVYSITPEALEVIKSYGTDLWNQKLESFLINKQTLTEMYAMNRDIHRIPVEIDGEVITLSSGDHNVLQKKIIEEFGAIFAQGSKLLYVGDTANKNLYKLDEELESLGIPITQHDKLPDVLLYNQEKNWLYLCEAVTSHGPISPKRYIELEEMLVNCTAGKVYVTCFLDTTTFKRYADDIAWETEVWIADMPTHMLHYNGDRFLGPRK